MTIPRTIPEQLADVYRRVAELERRARNRKRTGVVVEVDHAQGLARVELSRPDGRSFVTGWRPWLEVASGGVRSHIPPTVGEQVEVLSESGDLTDAVISMSIPSNANPRPHDGPEAVITRGASRIVIGDDLTTVIATNVRIVCEAQTDIEAPTINLRGQVNLTGGLAAEGGVTIDGDVQITGASVRHNAANIGDTHVHGGVIPGGADTAAPSN